MQIRRKHQPGDQSPGFLGIPAPVRSPRFVGPDAPGNNSDRQQREAQTNNPIANVIERIRQTEPLRR